MPGLSKKETAKLLAHIEPQGVIITPVKNGFLLRLPNGESTTIHLTGSDHRGPLNLRATLRRAGVSWPTDKATKKMYKTTTEKGKDVLRKVGNPRSIRVHDFVVAATLIDWKPTRDTVVNFLLSEGYIGVGATVNRRYVIPDEIIVEDKKPVMVVPMEPIDERPVTLEIREFIDTHDSHVIDLDVMPDTMSVKDVKLMLAAMGFQFEIRYWK